jgi:hypothetical protein
MKTNINTLGIIFSTLGSFLVWKYLTELNWADKGAFLRCEGVMKVPSPTAEGVEKFKRQLRLSKLGLALIIIGGAIQVFSNYLPE